MADIDLSGLNIDQLTGLVGKAQSEMACREKQRRRGLQSELERRIAAAGYELGEIIPEFRGSGPNGTRRRKMPVKFRNPQNPDEIWTGIGRSPKWVQAILDERGVDMAAFKGIPVYQIRPYNLLPSSLGETHSLWQRSEGINLVPVEAERSTSDATVIWPVSALPQAGLSTHARLRTLYADIKPMNCSACNSRAKASP